MKRHFGYPALAAALAAGIVLGQLPPAQAQLDKILKGGGIALIVDKFSGDIDRFVNKVTGNKPDTKGQSTRTVPILSMGKGTYVGAVQVSGPKKMVDQVKAVAQLEGSTKIGAEIRIKGLIPIANRDTKDALSLARVKGVGVSAIIDIRL